MERGDYQVDAEVANQFAAELDELPNISTSSSISTRSIVKQVNGNACVHLNLRQLAIVKLLFTTDYSQFYPAH